MQVNLAVVGAGYWGKNLVRNFNKLGVLRAVCDKDINCLEKECPPAIIKTTTYSDIINNSDINAVALASPAAFHYQMAKEALLAGKNVFVEKPLCLSVSDGAELIKLAEEKGRILMVGHLLQYHPAIVKLKGIIDEGQLGKIQYVYSNRLNLGKIRREENILWSFAPHDISVILSLVGEKPFEVSSTGGNYLNPAIADITLSTLSFKNGVKAHIFVSWLHPYKEQKLIVVGDRAMAVFDDMAEPKEKLLLFPHKINWLNGSIPVAVKENAVAVSYDYKEPLQEECQQFIDSVVAGTKPRTDGEEGLRVLGVLNSLQRSLEDGGKVKQLEAAAHKEQTFFVHPSSEIDTGVEIGTGTTIWHFSHLLKDTKIGANCKIGQNVVIGPKVVVGNGVKIQNNVSVYEGVVLEDDVFCGPSMVFTNVYNPRSEIARMSELRNTLIKKGATIGANATIVCGHTVGSYAFIGAGAVVTKDVPDHALVAGNPARRIGWMCKCGVKLVAHEGESWRCQSCGKRYQLKNNNMNFVEG